MKLNIIAIFSIIFASIYPASLFAKADVKQNIMSSLAKEDRGDFHLVSEDKFKINLNNRIVFDTNFDHNYQSTDRKDESTDARFNGRFFSTLNLTPNFFINSFLRFERVANSGKSAIRRSAPDGGGDRSFDDQGLFIEELVLVFNQEKYSLVAGKYTLNYGKGWLQGRGIWNHEFSLDYRQRDALGVGGVYHVGDRRTVGEYNFGFNLYTKDRKSLDNSLISRRDSSSKSDATPGDTRNLGSFLGTLDVKFDFGEKEKLSYHFAYNNLAVSERSSSVSATKVEDQKGFLANIRYQYPISENFDLDGMIEYTKINNLNGDSDIHQKYLIASLVTRFHDNWNVTIGTSNLQNIEIDKNGFDQNQSELSFGYDFDKTIFFDRLTLQAGYKNLRTNNKTSVDSQNSYGILARYFIDF